jgi:hypothetical protein
MHNLLVGYNKIAGVSYGRYPLMEVGIGQINLYGGQDLGCQQAQEKGLGCIGASMYIDSGHRAFEDQENPDLNTWPYQFYYVLKFGAKWKQERKSDSTI